MMHAQSRLLRLPNLMCLPNLHRPHDTILSKACFTFRRHVVDLHHGQHWLHSQTRYLNKLSSSSPDLADNEHYLCLFLPIESIESYSCAPGSQEPARWSPTRSSRQPSRSVWNIGRLWCTRVLRRVAASCSIYGVHVRSRFCIRPCVPGAPCLCLFAAVIVEEEARHVDQKFVVWC